MEPKIIALMGATGSGKSSMIKLITGDERIAIGHGLESGTQSIVSYNFSFLASNITLVDTPGFDDTYRSDAEILRSIVEWLTETYSEGIKLSGIIYLHNITNVRMQGSALRNLRVFQELCGRDCFKKVALCPTFWNVSNEEDCVLEKRLLELKENEGFWGGMIKNGSKVFSEPLDRNQAITMLCQLVGQDSMTLQVQREVVDEHKPLSETSALLTLKLEQARQEHEAMMAEARRQFNENLQQRERTFSEDLAGMRKLFEEKLAIVEQTNEKLRAEIEAKSNAPVVVASTRRKPVPPQLNRATTIPADQMSVASEIVRRRHEKYIKFSQYVNATVQRLEGGKKNGVTCLMFKQKSCYTMACVNCLKTIGGGNCYKCLDCSTDYAFVLCKACYYNPYVVCNDTRHNKQNMLQGRPNTIGTRCPRVITPLQNDPLFCRKCGDNVGRCFLHCCACSEAFDMCINCAVRGKHCPGHRNLHSRHKLEICARYTGE